MATYNNKIDVINKLKVYTSIKNSKSINVEGENSIGSLSSNNNDEIGYLLDIIVGTLGTTYLTSIISGVLGKFIPKSSKDVRNIMLSNLTNNNLPILPQTIQIPVAMLDLFGLFKNDPNSTQGLNSYPNDGFTKDFYNNCLKKPNQVHIYKSLNFKYIENLKVVEVSNQKSDDTNSFFNALLPTQIIDSKQLIAEVLNNIFSTLNKNKSKSDLTNEIQLDKILNKLTKDTFEDNQIFIFNDTEVNDLERELQNKINGVTTYDYVCGEIEAFLNVDDFNNEVDLINNLITMNADVNTRLDSIVNKSTENSLLTTDNKAAIKDNFFKKFIKSILNVLIKTLFLGPLGLILLILSNPSLVNGFNGIVDVLKNIKESLKKILCNIKKILVDFIFSLFRKEILKIVIPVFKQIVLEKKQSTVKIINSLATF